jgi:hypothetical protein
MFITDSQALYSRFGDMPVVLISVLIVLFAAFQDRASVKV